MTEKSYSVARLCVSAIVIFVAVSYSLQTFENCGRKPFLANDTPSYLEATSQFYEHNFQPDALRPFILPAILGVPMLFGKEEWIFEWAIFLNFAAWLASVLLVYSSILLLTDRRRMAFWGGVCFACSVGNILLVYQLLSESIFMLLLASSVCFFCRFLVKSSRKPHTQLAFSVILFVAASLVRTTTFYLAIVFIILSLLVLLKNKKIILAFFLATVTLVPIGFQLSQIKKQFGDIVISYSPYEGIFHYFNAMVAVIPDHIRDINPQQLAADWKKEYLLRGEKTPTHTDGTQNWQQTKQIASTEFYEFCRHKPAQVLAAYAICIGANSCSPHGFIPKLENYRKTAYFEKTKSLFSIVTAVQNVIYSFGFFIFLGYLLLTERKKMQITSKILLLISTLIVVNIISFSGFTTAQGDRYHLVLVPVFIINFCYFYVKKNIRPV